MANRRSRERNRDFFRQERDGPAVHDISVFVYSIRQIITADAIRASGGFRLKAAGIAWQFRCNAGAIADAIDSNRRRPVVSVGELIDRLRAEAVLDGDEAKLLPVEWFGRMDRIIADMAESVGVVIRHPRKA